ncbi:hypothetical protein ACFWMG_30905 [Streptomyces sp. NPDC127074]|uniref:hypothetical protein n=1 Tax=Streptomyces sp. NPDC127074 TaxID=3347130 RepID=UPI0036622656
MPNNIAAKDLLHSKRIAILHQAHHPPSLNGSIKPQNPFGYRDSSADIAFALASSGCSILTPTADRRPGIDIDWTFPDTLDGIKEAISLGADTLWANTNLYADHPLGEFIAQDHLRVVAQPLRTVEAFEDKNFCRAGIAKLGVDVPRQELVDLSETKKLTENNLRNILNRISSSFPVIVKPCRGRGSEGVRRVGSARAAIQHIESLETTRFGTKFLIEEYLPGDEWAITVMPPGTYQSPEGEYSTSEHWPLTAVRRIGHHYGVMPFSGAVSPLLNSEPAREDERLQEFKLLCTKIARRLNTTAPIRIDCRADQSGLIKAIDVNFKPSMTGPGRPGREHMSNLSAIAANAHGWTYTDLVIAISDNATQIRCITSP